MTATQRKKSITEIRNGQIVGHNSKSYNDKHPHNPVVMKAVREAKRRALKLNEKGVVVPDHEKRLALESLGSLPRPNIMEGIAFLVGTGRG